MIGAGITLHECLKAHETLKGEGMNVRVFDPFCIKPLDVEGIIANAKACGGNIVVVEDHYPDCLLYTSPSPRDATLSRMPSSA